MDLPIKIVITLFVAVVVGGAIILFAERTLTKGEQNLQTLGQTPEGVTIVQLPVTSTAADVQKLAAACRRMSMGSIDKQQCFVARGGIPGAAALNTLNGAPAEDFTISVTALPGATALFIDSDPLGKIIISS